MDVNYLGTVNLLDDATNATLISSDSFIELKSDGLVQGIQIELEHGDDFSITLEDAYISEYYTNGNRTKAIIVTDGTHSIDKIADIKGDYRILSKSAASSDGMVVLNESIVNDFSIGNAFPNPFNPSTTIELELNKESFVSINVYNVAGQLVDKVFAGDLGSSSHTITWNANSYSSGVYFMSVQINDHIETKKLMLVK